MRRFSIAAAVVATLAWLAVSPLAATASTWTGWITDDSCGAKGAKAEHKACAEKCLGKGGKLVFYDTTTKKILGLDNQSLAREHLGHLVEVTGELKDDAIVVASMRVK